MALIESWFNQDLQEPVKVRYLDGNVFSADNAGNLIGVNVFNNGSPASIAGSVAANVIRADGATVAVSGALSGNTATVVLNQSCYAVPGPISIVIKLTASGAITTLCAVVANVYQSSTDTIVDPGTIIPSIEALIAEIEAAIASVPADYSDLWASIAPVFDSSKTGGYKIGEYVRYDGKLYRFTADHSGSWSSSDVSLANLGEGIYDIQSKTDYYCDVLPSGSNFNDITYFSMYGISSSYTYTNKPPIESGFCITRKYSNGFVSQIAFELDYSQVFCRYMYGANWTAWSPFNYTDWKRRSAVLEGILSSGSDLNSLAPNTIVGLDSGNTYTNKPDVTSGIAISIPYTFNNTNIYQQIVISFGEGIFSRYKINTWSDWERIDADRVRVEIVGDKLPNNADFDDYKLNGIFGIDSTSTYSNNPLSSSGWLECRVFQFSNGGIYWQRASDLEGKPSYVRYKIFSNAWSDWVSEDIHDPQAVYYAFGDSTTYGQIGGIGGQSKYNYPAVTGKLLNMTVKNKAVGGQGLIKDWATIHTNFIEGLDMSDAALITVGWSYNDSGQYSSINFGAYTDTGDTTFIGKYFTIMKEFQQKCPNAQVILVTGFGEPDGQVGPPVVKPTLQTQFTYKYTFADGQKSIKEMYDTLEQMANLHGWPCVNQAKGTAFNQFNASTMFGDQIHPTSDGYYHYGNLLGARIAGYYGNVQKW